MEKAGTSGSEVEVTWEDQQNINKFGRLNNRLHELNDEIKAAKVNAFFLFSRFPSAFPLSVVLCIYLRFKIGWAKGNRMQYLN